MHSIYRMKVLSAAVLVLFTSSVAVVLAGNDPDGRSLFASDTQFISIDLALVEYPSARGIDPQPFILWRDNVTENYYGWIMTVDHETGMQLGSKLETSISVGHIPVAILWSKHIHAFEGRGVDPVPFYLFRDYFLYTYPVSWGADGTPTAGTPVLFPGYVDPDFYGYATCLTELPGSEFADDMSRVFIGTELGFVVVLMNSFPGELLYDRVISISDDPIVDLEPIPQYGYVALGVLTSNQIFGIDMEPGLADGSRIDRYSQVFVLDDPRISTLTDFDVFGIKDEPLTNPDTVVRLILADGTSDLALSSIGGQESGSEVLDLTIDSRGESIALIASGSLLMVPSDGPSVLYDPVYSEYTGSGGCVVNITDEENDGCSYTCGDANGDEALNVGDAVHLINYVFKQGPAPDPLAAGDPNCDEAVNVGDAVYLINYVFKSGPEPCCP